MPATPTPPPLAPTVGPSPAEGLTRERAPIERVAIRATASTPPEYVADVTSGLPNGCARFEGVSVSRSGTTITVTVWNTVPSGVQACTMIYGIVAHAVPLGGGFTPGASYTVRVHDQVVTFIAR